MSSQATDRCPNCFGPTEATLCPHCGWQPGVDNPPPALALGRVLDGRYCIGRMLGHGGFGITYLAWDTNLHLRLAIKEYLPRDTATRAPDGVSLAIYSGPAGEQFAFGLERFIEEARTLARFDQHPGIVTVKNFFRAHGTGYCVMDYVDGITLRQFLEQQPGGKIGVETALKLLMPVADALRAVHKEGLLHRDIAPDNIYLSQDGRIKLLDFGAARFAAGEHSKSLSIILKPGYSPEEQYRTKGKQGPWTDVYGLGATFYRAITGAVPPDALDRLNQDELVPPTRRGVAITPTQEAALLKALAVKADHRFQGMAALQQEWHKGNVRSPQPVADQNETTPARPVKTPPRRAGNKGNLVLLLMGVAWVLFVWVLFARHFSENVQTDRGDFRGGLAKVEAGATLEEGMAAVDRSDYARALAIFHPLAESGNATGQYYLGVMYQQGLGVVKDEAVAVRWYRKAAEQGYAAGQNNLGWMYKNGLGMVKDEAEAVRWYRKAADQGYASGQNNLGGMYQNGLGVVKDDAEAIRWYRKAAEQGNAAGQNNLGWMYQNGLGVIKDDAEAIRWFRMAADQGYATGQTNLGWMYADGLGVVKDEAEAVRWYRKAAEQGDAAGQTILGLMYADGRGVVKDEAEAVRWVRKAAEQGDAFGQFFLGGMYHNGLGVVKDEAEAFRWYSKAAEQGNADAKSALERLGR